MVFSHIGSKPMDNRLLDCNGCNGSNGSVQSDKVKARCSPPHQCFDTTVEERLMEGIFWLAALLFVGILVTWMVAQAETQQSPRWQDYVVGISFLLVFAGGYGIMRAAEDGEVYC